MRNASMRVEVTPSIKMLREMWKVVLAHADQPNEVDEALRTAMDSNEVLRDRLEAALTALADAQTRLAAAEEALDHGR